MRPEPAVDPPMEKLETLAAADTAAQVVADAADKNEGPMFGQPWKVAAVALALGFAVDTLALHQAPGLGLAVGLMIAIGVAAGSAMVLEVDSGRSSWLAVAGLVLAGFVGVRTSPVLLTLNIATALFLFTLIVRRASQLGLRWTVVSYIDEPMKMLLESTSGARSFLSTDLRADLSAPDRSRLRAVGLGLLLGIPLVVVFGSLFASADLVFGLYLERLAEGLALGHIFWRLVLSLAVALLFVGIWRSMRDPREFEAATPSERAGLDTTTAVTVLALLVALFGLFVITQVISHSPELIRNIDYSQNARSGFFQLVTVAFLVLNVLLALDYLTGLRREGRSLAFDRLAVVLIALTGVVMFGALERMRLYVVEFGYTELRFYTTIFMLWLGFVLVWFVRTVLRDQRVRFATGVIASGLVVLVGLNAVNPDATIVKLNWDRHADGAVFSDRYNSELSRDAIPVLAAIRNESKPGEWCFIDARLAAEQVDLKTYYAEHGWFGDSYAAWRARRSDLPEAGGPSAHECARAAGEVGRGSG